MYGRLHTTVTLFLRNVVPFSDGHWPLGFGCVRCDVMVGLIVTVELLYWAVLFTICEKVFVC